MSRKVDINEHFHPVLNEKPWRARLGCGSFLTFDFGRRVRKANHWYGTWHLWIYQCEWRIETDKREIVHSESPRNLIGKAVRNLENYPLANVSFDSARSLTTFVFSKNIRLTCSPYRPDSGMEDLSHKELWMFYMPNNQVLSAIPNKGLLLERSDLPERVSV